MALKHPNVDNSNPKIAMRGGGAIVSADTDTDEINRRHPLVEIFINAWIKYLDCYEGGLSFTKSAAGTDNVRNALLSIEHESNLREYLRRHKREKSPDFSQRKTRTHYANYCRPAVDFWVSAIYRDQQTRKFNKNKHLENFWHDVDDCGTPIQQFMQDEVAVTGQIFGWCGVLIDMPNPPELRGKKDVTVKEAKA